MATRGEIIAMLSAQGVTEFVANIEKASGAIDAMALSTAEAATMMDAASARMDAAFGSKSVAGMRDMNSELGTMKGHLRDILNLVGGPTIAAGLTAAYAVSKAISFNTTQTNLANFTGASSSQVAMASAMASANRSNGQNSNTSLQMVQSFWQAQGGVQSQASTAAFLQAASRGSKVGNVGGVDFAHDLAAVGRSLQGKGISKSVLSQVQTGGQMDWTKVAGQLVSIPGVGNTSLQAIMGALGTGALETYTNSGVGLAGFGADMAMAADLNIKPSQYATRMRTMMMMLQNPTTKGKNALAKLGLSNTALEDEMRKGGNTGVMALVDSRERAKNMSADDRAQIANWLGGGARGSGTFVTEMMQSDRVQQNEAQILKGDTSLDTKWQTYLKSASGQFNQIQVSIEDAAQSLGTALLPSVEKIAHDLTTVAKDVAPVVKPMFEAMGWALGNPVVIRTLEAMLALKGVSMLTNSAFGLVGGLQGKYVAGGGIASGAMGALGFSPMGSYRKGLGGSMGLGSGVVGTPAEVVAGGLLGPDGKPISQSMRETGAAGNEMVGGVMNGTRALAGMAGVLAGGAVGYASTSSGGSLIEGGLQGALSGALLGMAAGPWGAAAGALGGIVGALAGHFLTLGKNAQFSSSQISDMEKAWEGATLTGSSNLSTLNTYLASGDAGTKLAKAMKASGINSGQIAAALGDPKQAAALENLIGTGSNANTINSALNSMGIGIQTGGIVSGVQTGKANHSGDKDKTATNAAVLAWAIAHNKVPATQTIATQLGMMTLPTTWQDLNSNVKNAYAASHGDVWQNGQFQYRAAGGPTQGRRAYMVGEQGPELWMSNDNGMVLNNSKTMSLLKNAMGSSDSSAGMHFHEPVTVQVPAGTPRQQAQSFAKELARIGARQ